VSSGRAHIVVCRSVSPRLTLSFVYQSSHVEYSNIKIRAVSSNESAEAANSDGWDIYRSDHVYIHDSHVVNGDDW